MTRSRSPLAAAVLLLPLGLLIPACAEAPQPAAPPATAAGPMGYPSQNGQPGYGAPQPSADATAFAEPPPGDLQGQIAALSAAEAALNLAINGGAAQKMKKGEEADRAGPTPPGQPARPLSGTVTGGALDPCMTACTALASMTRAADHLCGLAGDGDARCDDAKTRVKSATDRVRASCPACEAASVGPGKR